MDSLDRETSTPAAETSPPRGGEELDVNRLESYLAPLVETGGRRLVVTQFPHGHSNLTYLLSFGDREYVLRRPPFGNTVKSAHDMGREYRVLAKLCEVYPPAPRPSAYCEDESVVGAPFYCMERRHGTVYRHSFGHEGLPSALVRELCLSLVDNLARLHAVDYRAAGLADLGKPEGYVSRQVQGWIRRYQDAKTDEVRSADEVADWLTSRMPAESGACVVHNDYKFDNVLFDKREPTRIAAVLDWEMATIGDPLLDLGTTLGYWVQRDDETWFHHRGVGPTIMPGGLSRREVVARYAERTGREVRDALYYYVFGLLKIGVIIQQIYARFHRGKTSDPRFATLDEQVRLIFQQATAAIERDRV